MEKKSKIHINWKMALICLSAEAYFFTYKLN